VPVSVPVSVPQEVVENNQNKERMSLASGSNLTKAIAKAEEFEPKKGPLSNSNEDSETTSEPVIKKDELIIEKVGQKTTVTFINPEPKQLFNVESAPINPSESNIETNIIEGSSVDSTITSNIKPAQFTHLTAEGSSLMVDTPEKGKLKNKKA
jgi:hypothetical protein